MKSRSKRPRRRGARRLSIERFERRDLLTTIEFLPVADNTLFEDSAGSLSNGAGDFLFAGRVAPLGSNEIRRGLLRFELADLPANAVINSVRVELTMSRTIAGDEPVSLHRAITDWGEGASDAPGQEGTGTSSQVDDATWVHAKFPGAMWSSPGGDFTTQASSTIQVGGDGRYAWSSAGLVSDVENWLANPAANFGWIVIGNELTNTTAKRFNSRENPIAASRPKLIVDFDVATDLDFGDAPTAAQSGFAADYPVTRDDDGARHAASSLILGSLIDIEADGLPTVDASGDGDDDDGVSFVTSLLATTSSTLSSIVVVSSQIGKLDGWIDFNRDGDWDDVGEQVFAASNLDAGQNILPLSIPSDAMAGVTGARFRLSSVGGLSPRGMSNDGEVEDYWVTILDGGISPQVTLQMVAADLQLSAQSGDLVLRSGSLTRFRAPVLTVGSLSVVGTAGDDSIMLNLGDGFVVPEGGLQLSGGSGTNSLVIVGSSGAIDFSDPAINASDVNTIDLSSADETTLTLDAVAVSQMAPSDKLIGIVAAQGDRIVVRQASMWRMSDPIIVDGRFHVTAMNQQGVQEKIQARVPHAWQNLLSAGDVNNDGLVSALDALVIINELRSQRFTLSNGDLRDPLDVPLWPGMYFDHNGDDRATALDALRVINELAGQSSGSQRSAGEVIEAIPVELVVSQVADDESALDLIRWVPLERVTSASSARMAVKKSVVDVLVNEATSEAISIAAVNELLSSTHGQMFSPDASSPPVLDSPTRDKPAYD